MKSPQEIKLESGKFRAVVSSLGASLHRFDEMTERGRQEIAWGYDGGPENKKGGQGDILMPFPSRVKAGRYSFNGQSHQMELNDKEGPNAIHGFVRTELWDVESRTDWSVSFAYRMSKERFASRGYPFSLELRVRYELSGSSLRCAFEARNIGSEPAPFGAGFHPYFKVGSGPIDDAEAELPVRSFVHFENLIPTGRLDPVEGSDVDFRKMRKIGATRFNHCFSEMIRGADGMTRARLRDPATGRMVTLVFGEPLRYLVVYTGDAIPAPNARVALAIEPMTCATDAFNHPEWGLEILQPGAKLQGSFTIEVS